MPDALFSSDNGPALTPEQRARHLEQEEAATPGSISGADARTQQLYFRYLAGELSWRQVQELREAPSFLGLTPTQLPP